jgi:hypothetical protein
MPRHDNRQTCTLPSIIKCCYSHRRFVFQGPIPVNRIPTNVLLVNNVITILFCGNECHASNTSNAIVWQSWSYVSDIYILLKVALYTTTIILTIASLNDDLNVPLFVHIIIHQYRRIRFYITAENRLTRKTIDLPQVHWLYWWRKPGKTTDLSSHWTNFIT